MKMTFRAVYHFRVGISPSFDFFQPSLIIAADHLEFIQSREQSRFLIRFSFHSWPKTLVTLRAAAVRQLGRHPAAWATLVWIILHMSDGWHSHFLPACIWQMTGSSSSKAILEGSSCWYHDGKKIKFQKDTFPLCCSLFSKLDLNERFYCFHFASETRSWARWRQISDGNEGHLVSFSWPSLPCECHLCGDECPVMRTSICRFLFDSTLVMQPCGGKWFTSRPVTVQFGSQWSHLFLIRPSASAFNLRPWSLGGDGWRRLRIDGRIDPPQQWGWLCISLLWSRWSWAKRLSF